MENHNNQSTIGLSNGHSTNGVLQNGHATKKMVATKHTAAQNGFSNGHSEHQNGHSEHQNGHSEHQNGHSEHQNGHMNGHSEPKQSRYEDPDSHYATKKVFDSRTKDVEHERQFFLDMFQLMYKETVLKTPIGDDRVANFYHPEELPNQIDLTIRDDPVSHERLLELSKRTIELSVKPCHPYFFNQLLAGQDLYGLAGSWLTDAINASQYTFEVAPLFTVMETEIMNRLRAYCGFETGDGIFCPGGSVANMYALNVARHAMFPEIKEKGNGGRTLVAFTSEQCHYSVKKGVALLGIGTDNLKFIPTDKTGKMLTAELEKAIIASKERGETPYFVNATAGTTVLGAYDPLVPIGEICKKYGLWFHVDAAWGGGGLISKKYRHYLNGIENGNSVTWCPHKLMGVPLQCSAFLLNGNEDLLFKAHNACAKYLFQQDKFYDVSWDTGDKSIQCSRKVDAFKLWIMWKAKGNTGFEMEMDRRFDCARYMAKLIKEREGFELCLEPEAPNVCFWYVPPSLRGMEKTPEYWAKLHKVAPEIKKRMVTSGSMMCGYQTNKDLVNFWRMIFASRTTRNRDVEWVIDEIETLGKDIVIE